MSRKQHRPEEVIDAERRIADDEIKTIATRLANAAHVESRYDAAAGQSLANAGLILWGLLRKRGAVGPIQED